MPPVLDPTKSKVDGLAFLGLSLARHSTQGHTESVTHQTAFDLNDVIDRDYEHIFSTDDSGWLVGGGEPGPPNSYKLAAKDSAHVEIMRIGTYRPEWGGVSEKEILEVLKSGKIFIPQIEVLPTAVVENDMKPPELEIRFDMEPSLPNFDDMSAPLPVNWALPFIHNQLFKHFQFPSRFCPGPFHSTITRKGEFRSHECREGYFAKCDNIIQEWKKEGPKPLINEKEGRTEDFNSGIWLFQDRDNITQFFPPNFLPPYDTPTKRKIILKVLQEKWDPENLEWKPVGKGEVREKPIGITHVIPMGMDGDDKYLVSADTSLQALNIEEKLNAGDNAEKKPDMMPRNLIDQQPAKEEETKAEEQEESKEEHKVHTMEEKPLKCTTDDYPVIGTLDELDKKPYSDEAKISDEDNNNKVGYVAAEEEIKEKDIEQKNAQKEVLFSYDMFLGCCP